MQLTMENVEQVVIKESYNKAVFLYFYMEDQACAASKNALQTAISDDNAYISLVLADVATDVAQAIAMQIGLRGVPALIIFKDGQPVDSLQGNDIVVKLNELMQKYMPSEAELNARQALEFEANNNFDKALELISAAFNADNSNLTYKHIYTRVLIKCKKLDEAKNLLDTAGREERDSQEYQDLLSAYDLAVKALNSPELLKLAQDYEANQNDDNICINYAVALKEAGKTEQALQILFDRLKVNVANQEVKKVFLDMLNTLSGSKLQSEYRRKLYTILY